VHLEWGPLSLVSTIKKLLGRNSSGTGLESSSCLVSIVRFRSLTKVTEFSLVFNIFFIMKAETECASKVQRSSYWS
jgi:hypothetical protein